MLPYAIVDDVGFLDKLRSGLRRTTEQFKGQFDRLASESRRDEQGPAPVSIDTVEALEEILREADVGVAATMKAGSVTRR